MKTINNIISSIGTYAIVLLILGTAGHVYLTWRELAMLFVCGALQGITTYLINVFVGSWLLRFVLRGLKSYLLALPIFFFREWGFYFWTFTIGWAIIFLISFVYHYYTDKAEIMRMNAQMEKFKK